MKNLFLSLRDINGSISAKRVVMYIIVLLFVVEVLGNMFFKLTIDPVLKSQVFYGFTIALGTVFFEQTKEWIKASKQTTCEPPGEEKKLIQ